MLTTAGIRGRSLVLPLALLAGSWAAAVQAGGVPSRTAQAPAASDTVAITTDASTYAPGDPVTVTLVNGTTTAIAPPGGIVCQGTPWPFVVQRLADANFWQDLDFPGTPPCVGIAVRLIAPGESQTRTIVADARPGTYRVALAYTPTDGSGPALGVSDPYEVASAAAQQAPDGSETMTSLDVGYLEGQVNIGPLQPVQRAGASAPTPSPETCTSRGLVVYLADTGAQVARFALGPDCTYSAALPPGDYRVDLEPRGLDRSADLPRLVTISAGQTLRLDLAIDTGLR